jgi:hypothetical protein
LALVDFWPANWVAFCDLQANGDHASRVLRLRRGREPCVVHRGRGTGAGAGAGVRGSHRCRYRRRSPSGGLWLFDLSSVEFWQWHVRAAAGLMRARGTCLDSYQHRCLAWHPCFGMGGILVFNCSNVEWRSGGRAGHIGGAFPLLPKQCRCAMLAVPKGKNCGGGIAGAGVALKGGLRACT